jgi:hypothetical protein
VYKWTDRRGEHCKSTAEVLAEVGFNTYWGTSIRKVPSVILINVKTPVPGDSGKTHINQVACGEAHCISKQIPANGIIFDNTSLAIFLHLLRMF